MPGDVIRVKTSLFWDAMNLFSPVAGPAAIAAATAYPTRPRFRRFALAAGSP